MSYIQNKFSKKTIILTALIFATVVNSFIFIPKIYASSPIVEVRESMFTHMFESVLVKEFHTDKKSPSEFIILEKEHNKPRSILSAKHTYTLHIYDTSSEVTHSILVTKKLYNQYENQDKIELYPSTTQMMYVTEENNHVLLRIAGQE